MSLLLTAALASTITCSSADQRYSYRHFQSDGGANMSSETVQLDGTTVLERINFEVVVQTAALAQGEQKVLAGPTTGTDGATRTTYAQQVVLTADDRAELFSGFALCESVQGPICPICP
jgi:hypothetical protein